MTRAQILQEAYNRGFEKAAQEAAEAWRQQAASRDWSGDLSTANDYLARTGRDGKPLFGTDLTGQHFVNASSNTLANTGIHVPVPFAMSVGQLETSLGGNLKSQNNTFNVGNFDDGRTRDFETPQAGVSAFSDLVANDYLKHHDGDVDALLAAGFRNHAGNRYASAADYAEKVRKQRDFIARGSWRGQAAQAPAPTPAPVTVPAPPKQPARSVPKPAGQPTFKTVTRPDGSTHQTMNLR